MGATSSPETGLQCDYMLIFSQVLFRCDPHFSQLWYREGFGNANKDLSVNDGEEKSVSCDRCLVICLISLLCFLPIYKSIGLAQNVIFLCMSCPSVPTPFQYPGLIMLLRILYNSF